MFLLLLWPLCTLYGKMIGDVQSSVEVNTRNGEDDVEVFFISHFLAKLVMIIVRTGFYC